ncbi:hypothetical protein ANTPLA_LOCUS4250 [Anthophora plagiata]
MDSTMPMRPDKKLGNVLAPKIQPARKPRSYLELYRRRFSGPQYNVRSPEGSTLSVCGDSEREQLSDDDTGSLVTPRDDQSELSFYRRIIEGSTDLLAPVARSIETVHLRELQDTNISSTCSNGAKQDQPGDKSKKGLGYRPYTIEEYKTLPVPKLDRSLGPDKVEMQAKREWLMRRRSYGNSVSARNRQRILLLQAHRHEVRITRNDFDVATSGCATSTSESYSTREIPTRRFLISNSRDDIAEKCFLPPLKDQEVDAKTQSNSLRSTISDDQETIEKSSNMNSDRCFKKNHNIRKISSSRRSKKFERTSSFCSSLNSYDVIEDSYLESLRQRHLYEKEMVDRIINQALCP